MTPSSLEYFEEVSLFASSGDEIFNGSRAIRVPLRIDIGLRTEEYELSLYVGRESSRFTLSWNDR